MSNSRGIAKGKGKAQAPDHKLMETFENVHLDLSKQPGRCRFADSGLGWKTKDAEPYTLDKTNISSAQWSRAARGHEVKILTRNGEIVQLDGFQENVESLLRVSLQC